MEARNRESARAATDFSATRRCAIGADMTDAATTKSRACVHGPISTSTRFHRAWARLAGGGAVGLLAVKVRR